ncbi:Inosine-5'-monophosphate dehydrogenase [Candidatus Norongarragalina meridionalis]|nr:Inosine-5'-monophosphate dehydrogenase [Candidatus Norongarragalina meridionalis]
MDAETAAIRRRRAVLGMTQSELAKEAGVSQSLVAKLEAGTSDASYSRVKRLLDVLDEKEHATGLKASDAMSRRLCVVAPHEKASKAVSLMGKKGVSQLPVLEGERAVGSLSEEDVLARVEKGADLSSETVAAIMAPPFPQVDEAVPLQAVVALLMHEKAVLVTKRGKIAGIITKSDVLSAASKRHV